MAATLEEPVGFLREPNMQRGAGLFRALAGHVRDLCASTAEESRLTEDTALP